MTLRDIYLFCSKKNKNRKNSAVRLCISQESTNKDNRKEIYYLMPSYKNPKNIKSLGFSNINDASNVKIIPLDLEVRKNTGIYHSILYNDVKYWVYIEAIEHILIPENL